MKTVTASVLVALAASTLAAEPVPTATPAAAAETVPLPPPPPPPVAEEPAAPAAAVTAAVPAAPAPAPAPARGRQVVIGPKLNLVTLPAPGFGVEARIADTVTVSFDYGLWPEMGIPGSAGDAKIAYRDVGGAVRWHPWHGSFFLGAALGVREFRASVTDSTTRETAKAKVSSTYLAPELGFRWMWRSGFFLGMDLGYQIILSDKTTLTLPAAVDVANQQDVIDAADEIGKLGFPVLSLLQLGWYF